MRKIIFVILSLTLAIPLYAKIKILTTTQDLAVITKAVTGDLFEVGYISSGRVDPHHVELKPSYAIKVRDAQILIRTGLGLDDWILALIDTSRNQKVRIGKPGHINASRAKINIISKPKGKIDRSMGDIHGQGDPHYLLHPKNGLEVARYITIRLSALYPHHKTTLQKNLAHFNQQYHNKMEQWVSELTPLKGNPVITYHRTWDYFLEFTGLISHGELEPKPGIPPSAKHTGEILNIIKKQNISIIIQAPWFETRTAAFVKSKIPAINTLILPGQVGALPPVKTYWDLFDYNIKVIKQVIP